VKLVAVKTSMPFARTKSDALVDDLVAKLNQFGHEAEVVRIPYSDESVEGVLKAMVAASMLRIRGVDRIVVHDFPSYYVRHENKVAWFTEPSPGGASQAALAQAALNMDARQFATMRLYAVSEAAQAVASRISGLAATIVPAPAGDDDDGWRGVVEALTA